MRGLGPYVINELTTGGAVRLETLDGEPMANFINGSCLKRFHEPLTQEMLEKMHAARTRKEALETMKKEAREEARQRAAKAKSRRHQVSMVHVCKQDAEDYVQPMLLPLGINHAYQSCTALLDSGADVNVMAAHIYEAYVKQPLTSTTSNLNNVGNQSIVCHGMTTASIYVNGHKENCQFYVTKNEESAHDVILGRSWMSRHKCQFNWEAHSISFVIGTKKVTIPTADITRATQNATTLPPKPTSRTRPTHRQSANQRSKQLQSRVHQSNTYIWEPKYNTASTTYNRQKQFTNTMPTHVACQRWVPKTWLQAQNFYKGNRLIWVPKKVNDTTVPQHAQTQNPKATSYINTHTICNNNPK